MARRAAAVVTAAVLVGLLGGCQHPVAQRRLRQDTDSLRFTAKTCVDSEARRPGNLRWISQQVADDVSRNARDTAANPGKIADLINRDVRRFEGRQGEYWKTAGESTWGHPEKIEVTAIHFVY